MRRKMKGIHEARDKHDRRLFRLFCLLDRDLQAMRRTRPAIVLLGGAIKDVNTAMDDDVYDEILMRRDRHLKTTPRPMAPDGFMGRWLVELTGDLPL